MTYSVVIPTVGRPSLTACLRGLAESIRAGGPAPVEVFLIDDRSLTECGRLNVEAPEELAVRVEYGCGHGPAAARNAGWRRVSTPWVVFLDDDVVPGPSWAESLASDLAGADARVGAVQGRIEVPLPDDRRPTDAERNTAGLATSRWITADIAYRVEALAAVGGFDERFRRAFREDADLALRVQAAGWSLTTGQRVTVHPVRPDGPLASVRAQAGNADDVLMTRLHGTDWWERADAPRGRFARHTLITAAGVLTALAAGASAARAVHRSVAYRPPKRARLGRWGAAAAAVWAAGTAEFAAARIAPGPRTRREIATMVATSVLIPPAALAHHVRGRLRHRSAAPWSTLAPAAPAPTRGTAIPAPHGPAAEHTNLTGDVDAPQRAGADGDSGPRVDRERWEGRELGARVGTAEVGS